MIISFLIGAAIGYMAATAIAEIFFTIYDRLTARETIKIKTKERDANINKLVVFVNNNNTYTDEEEFVLKAYDKNDNYIANINVTTPSDTGIKVGEKIYV